MRNDIGLLLCEEGRNTKVILDKSRSIIFKADIGRIVDPAGMRGTGIQ